VSYRDTSALFELRRALARKELDAVITRGAARRIYRRFCRDAGAGYVQMCGIGSELDPHFETVLTRCVARKP
jgi:hypothetical protein